MGDTALKGSTISASYDWLVFRGDAFSSTGNKINLMNDSGTVQASNFYIDPTNDRIGIGAATPASTLHLSHASTAPVLTMGLAGSTDGVINAPHSLFINMDSDANGTGHAIFANI